jgi:hypothetical protein
MAPTLAALVAGFLRVATAWRVLRGYVGVARIALLPTAATLTAAALVLLATLIALAIGISGRVRRGGRVDGVGLAATLVAALVIAALRSLPTGIVPRGVLLRWPLLTGLLWILWLAWLAPWLSAPTMLACAPTGRIGYGAARIAALGASACWLLTTLRAICAIRGGGAGASRLSEGAIHRWLRLLWGRAGCATIGATRAHVEAAAWLRGRRLACLAGGGRQIRYGRRVIRRIRACARRFRHAFGRALGGR